ncbi:MAG: PrsW family intramembrane metalloprotease [Halanaeroarchaeum sp.]
MGDETPRDPIQRAAGDGTDLYDVVTWERRSTVDRLATRLYGALVLSTRAIVIGLAVLILLGQVALTAAATLRDPLIGIYIVASVIPALFIVIYVWHSDVTAGQSLSTLVATYLLGLLFASFAAVVNSSVQGLFAAFGTVGLVVFFYLIVAPIEEAVKLLAVRMHAYRKPEFAAVIDGAVYGAVAGLGFATIENAIYISQQYAQTVNGVGTGGLLAALQTAAVRSFAGPGHVIYSSFAGYYLGLARFNPDDRGPIVVKGIVVAAFIHGTYNALVTNLQAILGVVDVLAALPPAIGFVGFVIVYDGVFLAALVHKLRTYGRAFERTGARAYVDDGEQGDDSEDDGD